jgi:hypothetical protein
MKRDLIVSIVKGYENQLLNAEIEKNETLIKWLKIQISEGLKALATKSVIISN